VVLGHGQIGDQSPPGSVFAPPHLVVTHVPAGALVSDEVRALVDVERAAERFRGVPRTGEVVGSKDYGEPVRDLRPILDLEVEHRPRACGAAAERLSAARIGEDVVAVAPAFYDGQRRVQRHPVEQVRQLAQPPADALRESAVIEHEAVDESALARRASDPMPE
jgi:hypothetical protein